MSSSRAECHVSAADAEVERRYSDQRRLRIVSNIKVALVPYIIVAVFDAFAQTVAKPEYPTLYKAGWYALEVTMILLLAAQMVCFRYFAAAFRYFDVANLLMGFLFLPFCVWEGAFGIEAELQPIQDALYLYVLFGIIVPLKTVYTAVLLHVFILCRLGLALSFNSFGTDEERWWPITACTYCLIVALLIHSRKNQQSKWQIFQVRAHLEEQTRYNLEFVESEHKLKLEAVQQEARRSALLSFVHAVFDVFGELTCDVGSEFEEPRLCFSSAADPALEALLGRPAAGMPLDILLGASPAEPGDERDQWQEERQRLWNYATREASVAGKEKAEAGIAGKVKLACKDADANKIEIELFILRINQNELLFGITQGSGERIPAPAAVDKEVAVLGFNTSQKLRGAGGRSIASVTSILSCSSIGSSSEARAPIEEGCGEVSVWVDVADATLPIKRSSTPFNNLLGGPMAVGTSLADWISNGGEFAKVIAGRIPSKIPQQGDADLFIGDALTELRSHQCRRWTIVIKAWCSIKIVSAPEGAWGPQEIPAALTFYDVQEPILKRHRHRKRDRAAPVMDPQEGHRCIEQL